MDIHNVESLEGGWIWGTRLSRDEVIPVGDKARRSRVSSLSGNSAGANASAEFGKSDKGDKTQNGREGIRELHDFCGLSKEI